MAISKTSPEKKLSMPSSDVTPPSATGAPAPGKPEITCSHCERRFSSARGQWSHQKAHERAIDHRHHNPRFRMLVSDKLRPRVKILKGQYRGWPLVIVAPAAFGPKYGPLRARGEAGFAKSRVLVDKKTDHQEATSAYVGTDSELDLTLKL